MTAIRAVVRCGADGEAAQLRAATVERARDLGLLGWVRADEEGELLVHAEGDPAAVDELAAFLRTAGSTGDDELVVERVRAEGHEQFAIRGVSAGIFVVQEHAAAAHHFDLRLEVDGIMRSWAVPKGPSLDPAVKRMAIEVGDHATSHNTFEGKLGGGGVLVWDHGTYEQAVASPGRRRSAAATRSSSCTARSCGAASRCSAPALARSRNGC